MPVTCGCRSVVSVDRCQCVGVNAPHTTEATGGYIVVSASRGGLGISCLGSG